MVHIVKGRRNFPDSTWGHSRNAKVTSTVCDVLENLEKFGTKFVDSWDDNWFQKA